MKIGDRVLLTGELWELNPAELDLPMRGDVYEIKGIDANGLGLFEHPGDRLEWRVWRDEDDPFGGIVLAWDFPVGVNVWDADVYGNGRESGLRWTIYEDDPDKGYLTHTILAGGPLPQHMHERWGSDDDWISGDAVAEFINELSHRETGKRRKR